MPIPKSPTRKIKSTSLYSNKRDNQNERACNTGSVLRSGAAIKREAFDGNKFKTSGLEDDDRETVDLEESDFYETSSRRAEDEGLSMSQTMFQSGRAGRASSGGSLRSGGASKRQLFDPELEARRERRSVVQNKYETDNEHVDMVVASPRSEAAVGFKNTKTPKSKKKQATCQEEQFDDDKASSVFRRDPLPKTAAGGASGRGGLASQKRGYLSDEDDGSEYIQESSAVLSNQNAGSSKYPDLINKMMTLCYNERDFIKDTCAGRLRTQYQKMFMSYKDKMTPRDRAIISSGIDYIYNFSRINSIPKENAEWLISIHEIPISHIVSYTSKDVLKNMAKQYGIPCSNKKAEEIVAILREVLEKN